jgi:hypothetical protein
VAREREGLSRARGIRRTNSWRRGCGVWVYVCNVERTVDRGHGPQILGAVLTTSPGALSRDGLVWRLALWPKLPAFEQLSMDHGPALFMPGPARGVASPLQAPCSSSSSSGASISCLHPPKVAALPLWAGWLAHANGRAVFLCLVSLPDPYSASGCQMHASTPCPSPTRYAKQKASWTQGKLFVHGRILPTPQPSRHG